MTTARTVLAACAIARLVIPIACLSFPAPIAAAEGVALEPNAVLSWEFPELPETLAAMDSGRRQPPRLTAYLPADYDANAKFPLFVYLLGGPGGRGGPDDAALGRSVIGPKGWIVVTMPLFKKRLDPTEPSRGLMISMDDAEVLSRGFGTMLRNLLDTLPNVDPERSVFGGHSNGAHATGVLLAAQDEFLLRNFRAFFLHEGGIGPLFANVLHKPAMRTPRFLVMTGGGSPGSPAPFRDLAGTLHGMTERGKLDFAFVTMAGYGHDQPPEYLRVVGQWARGERLDDVPARNASLAAALERPLSKHPDTAEWADLLNADLSNCTHGGGWKLSNGVARAVADKPLWTKSSFGDCILDFEFVAERGARGEVLLRCSDPERWESASVRTALGDPAGTDDASPTRRAAKPAGERNRMTIVCGGDDLTVILNGAVVTKLDLSRRADDERGTSGRPIPEELHGGSRTRSPERGRIGLRGRTGDRGIEFRNIKLLPLPNREPGP